MEKQFVTTSFSFEGYVITEYIGIVRGITVRSRSIFGNIAGGLQSLIGGNISIYTELCEKSRQEAFELMIHHAEKMNANAIIGIHYDTNEILHGVTEVLCYGTAVRIDKI